MPWVSLVFPLLYLLRRRRRRRGKAIGGGVHTFSRVLFSGAPRLLDVGGLLCHAKHLTKRDAHARRRRRRRGCFTHVRDAIAQFGRRVGARVYPYYLSMFTMILLLVHPSMLYQCLCISLPALSIGRAREPYQYAFIAL